MTLRPGALAGLPVADVLAEVVARHPGAGMEKVVRVSSVLVGGRAVKDRSQALAPSDEVEILPPFAGG